MKQEYAYPSPVDPKTGTNQLGITVRDYFAAKVLQGFLSSSEWTVLDHKDVAEGSYKIADAMMEARK